MTGKRVTLADVARRAGVSTAVVSYVLNDGPRPVSAQLRERVNAALDELDYRPDPVARALRKAGRWGQLGLLVPEVTLPYFGLLASHIEKEARRRGRLVLTGTTSFDADLEAQFARSFADAGVDGLIVAGEGPGHATAEVCARARVPVVWVHNDRQVENPKVVRGDHFRGGQLAAEHLVREHGRANVLFVGGFTAEATGVTERGTVGERYRGYAAVLGASAGSIVTDLTLRGAYRAVRRHLDEHGAPDGLVVGTYGQSAAVLRALTDSGFRVPRDVSVVTFDSDPRNDYEQIVLTTVQQHVEVVARQAIDLVLARTARGAPPAEEIVGVYLHTGESCGCPAAVGVD